MDVNNNAENGSILLSQLNRIYVHLFSDQLQHKLDSVVCQYSISKTIKNDIFKWITVECGEERFECEGEFRLVQALINAFDCTDDNLEYVKSEFNSLCAIFYKHILKGQLKSQLKQQTSKSEHRSKIYKVLEPLICAAKDSFTNDASQHRNLCLYFDAHSELDDINVIQYLTNIFQFSQDSITLLLAFRIIRKLPLKKLKVSNENLFERIVKCLETQAEYFNQNDTLELCWANNEQIDYLHYRVGFESRWFIDSLNDDSICDPLLKLSPDRQSVQMNANNLQDNNQMNSSSGTICSVRSSFAITSGVYYYECIILSNGFMSIGWTTKESELGEWRQVGIDQYSIGFDGFHQCLWHRNKCAFLSTSHNVVPYWKTGDVLGCLLDVPKRVFQFCLNGEPLACSLEPSDVYFSSQAYFAAASLTQNQICCFNFGQAPFRHPPQNVTIQSFHSTCNLVTKKYHLLEPTNTSQMFWFKDELGSELFFNDSKQRQYNQIIIELDQNISFNSTEYQTDLAKLESQLNHLFHEPLGPLRLGQSILVEMSQQMTFKKINWIRWTCLEHITEGHTFESIELIEDYSVNASIARFIEFIYPNLQSSNVDSTKRRNICLVLSLLAPRYRFQSQLLIDEITSFLVETITQCDKNKQALLFALVCLNSMDLNKGSFSPNVNAQFDEFFVDKLKRLSTYMRKSRHLNPYTLDFVQYQIAFCAYSLRKRILNQLMCNVAFQLDDIEDSESRVLSSLTLCSELQLSADQLSARSDHGWQSGLSSFEVLPSSDSYYFEVILLTSGPMRIGWAAACEVINMDMPVGQGDCHSIAFDGFRKSIFFYGKEYPIVRAKEWSRWKSGDVVGCTIDFASHSFAFYLNGRQIKYKIGHNGIRLCLDRAYCVAISLATQQQCYCNFGQRPFRYVC